MNKILVQKDEFSEDFINPLSRFGLEYTPIQICKTEDGLIGMSHTPTCSIMGHVILKNVKGEVFDPLVLKDTYKLKSALAFITEPTITLSLDEKYIMYDGDSVKIKSFMLDKRAFDENQPKKILKILDMDFDSSFVLAPESLTKIKKSKEFSQTNKIYIDLNEDGVSVSRKDDEKPSVGTLSFKIGESYSGDDVSNLPFSMDIFDLIQNKKDDILIQVNKKFGILTFQLEDDNKKITYITSALRK